MDQMPTELLENILKYVGGIGFLHFRCTTKRFKGVADNMELRPDPSLWYRFTLQDFTLSAIGSLIPWMVFEESCDAMIWKTVYMILTKSKKARNSVKTMSILTRGYLVPLATDLKFIGTQLCVLDQSRIAHVFSICKKSNSHKYFPLTDLQYTKVGDSIVNVPFGDELHLSYSMDDIVVKPINLRDQSQDGVKFIKGRILEACHVNRSTSFLKGGYWMQYSITLVNSNEILINTFDIHGNIKGTNTIPIGRVSKVVMADIDQEKIVLMSKDRTLNIFVIDMLSRKNRNCSFKYSLPDVPVCFQLMDDYIICLYESNGLCIAKLTRSHSYPSHRFKLWPWHSLHLWESGFNISSLPEMDKVIDFSIQGLCLVVATKSGKIFVGHQEDWNHWKFSKPFQINLHESGFLIRITVDINVGLTVAALETFYCGSSWISEIHLLYLD